MFIVTNATSVDRVVAGEYALTDGQGIAVCEVYRKNFESRHDIEPMACERRYSPAILQLYREAEINLATSVDGGQGTVIPEKDEVEMAKALDFESQVVTSRAICGAA